MGTLLGLLVCLLTVNVVAFVLFGIDKNCARKGLWRIPEETLLFIAIIGGSIGAILGMRWFHHKTLHPKFQMGLPLILVVQVMLCLCFMLLSVFLV